MEWKKGTNCTKGELKKKPCRYIQYSMRHLAVHLLHLIFSLYQLTNLQKKNDDCNTKDLHMRNIIHSIWDERISELECAWLPQ